jgi:hypothetical protein
MEWIGTRSPNACGTTIEWRGDRRSGCRIAEVPHPLLPGRWVGGGHLGRIWAPTFRQSRPLYHQAPESIFFAPVGCGGHLTGHDVTCGNGCNLGFC